MEPENVTNEAVAKKPEDAPIIGPVATEKEQSEKNDGTTHALIPAEDFVVWLDPSVGDKPAQIIEATEANLRTIAAAAPDVDYRLDKVKNTGMTKLTRLTETDWSEEVVVAMGETCVFISESLEDMLFERTLPLDANVAPLFRQMVSVVKSYGESIGDEALNLISFAYVENCGRFSNQKRDFNMEYSGKSLIAVGGVAQSIVKKAYTWANTMPQFQSDLLMHTVLEQDKLVFTSKGIMVVFPPNAEPGAFELDTFKDIFGGTLTVSVPMFVSSKEIGPKDFRKKGPGYEAVTESFGAGVIKSINTNAREANDTGITSLYVQVYVSKEENALRTMAKLNLEGKGEEGTMYAGKGFSIRYSSSLPTARARNGLIAYAELKPMANGSPDSDTSRLDSKLSDMVELQKAQSIEAEKRMAEADQRNKTQAELIAQYQDKTNGFVEQLQTQAADAESRLAEQAKSHDEALQGIQQKMEAFVSLVAKSTEHSANALAGTQDQLLKTQQQLLSFAATTEKHVETQASLLASIQHVESDVTFLKTNSRLLSDLTTAPEEYATCLETI